MSKYLQFKQINSYNYKRFTDNYIEGNKDDCRSPHPRQAQIFRRGRGLHDVIARFS